MVKAFNTTFAGTLSAGAIGRSTTTVMMAGDAAEARAMLARVITAGGPKVTDVGALKRARELEALELPGPSLTGSETISWSGGFGVVD